MRLTVGMGNSLVAPMDIAEDLVGVEGDGEDTVI